MPIAQLSPGGGPPSKLTANPLFKLVPMVPVYETICAWKAWIGLWSTPASYNIQKVCLIGFLKCLLIWIDVVPTILRAHEPFNRITGHDWRVKGYQSLRMPHRVNTSADSASSILHLAWHKSRPCDPDAWPLFPSDMCIAWLDELLHHFLQGRDKDLLIPLIISAVISLISLLKSSIVYLRMRMTSPVPLNFFGFRQGVMSPLTPWW